VSTWIQIGNSVYRADDIETYYVDKFDPNETRLRLCMRSGATYEAFLKPHEFDRFYALMSQCTLIEVITDAKD
jgi:hypothetical protein